MNQQQARTSQITGHQELKDDLARLNEEISQLEETANPLAQAAKDSHKYLSNGAHDATVGGEKDLLGADYLVDPTI